jgi:hypothetical protein
MSKALDEVMQYSNEDVASISKHWIIFVKAAISVLIKAVVLIFLYFKTRTWLDSLADMINESFEQIPFEIKKYLLLILMVLIVVSAIKRFVSTYIEYKTVGLIVNNIQIKGKSGLVNVGVVNASLEQVAYVKVFTPLWGRIFHYGNIEVSLAGGSFTMIDMVNIEQFQDAIVMLQEAQKEGRNIRGAERNAETVRAQTMAQVQALTSISQTMAQGIAQNKNMSIEENKVEAIEEKLEN